jgi:hypothetical protein
MMIKKCDVRIGSMYIAKVTNRLVEVRIDSESQYGGWNATNTVTGKNLRIRSVQRLRGIADGTTSRRTAKSKEGKELAKVELASQPAQTSSPTIEETANAEPIQIVCPICGGAEADAEGDCTKCLEPKLTEQANKQKPPASKETKKKRMGGLDAAAKVLEETGVPMNVKEITAVALAKSYWKPSGRTPSATLSAALMREIAKKGDSSRFRKSERGRFVLNR